MAGSSLFIRFIRLHNQTLSAYEKNVVHDNDLAKKMGARALCDLVAVPGRRSAMRPAMAALPCS